MKISLTNMSAYRQDAANFSKINESVSNLEKNTRNYDAITIQSNSRQIRDKKFSEALSKAISEEIKAPTSQEKISSLQNQVANGFYSVDSGAIASRILLVKEDTTSA